MKDELWPGGQSVRKKRAPSGEKISGRTIVVQELMGCKADWPTSRALSWSFRIDRLSGPILGRTVEDRGQEKLPRIGAGRGLVTGIGHCGLTDGTWREMRSLS